MEYSAYQIPSSWQPETSTSPLQTGEPKGCATRGDRRWSTIRRWGDTSCKFALGRRAMLPFVHRKIERPRLSSEREGPLQSKSLWDKSWVRNFSKFVKKAGFKPSFAGGHRAFGERKIVLVVKARCGLQPLWLNLFGAFRCQQKLCWSQWPGAVITGLHSIPKWDYLDLIWYQSTK